MSTVTNWSLWPPAFLRCFRFRPRMRMAVLTWGTRGDVQPFVALGAELLRRGHEVVLAARAPFRSLVEAHGIEFFEMEDDGTDQMMVDMANSDGGPGGLKVFAGFLRTLVGPQFRQFSAASVGADVLLTNAAFTAPALHLAEHSGRPIFQAFFDPNFIPTRRYCFSDNRIRDLGPLRNIAVTRGRNLLFGLFIRDLVNKWRRERGMPIDWTGERHRPSQLFRLPVFAAWTDVLVPRPDDWPPWIVQTGHFRLPALGAIDPRLVDFMNAGPPPIYVGFGSWGVHDKTALTELILAAAARTGERLVLHRNTIDARRSFPPHVHVADELPHHWLFPRVKAVIHHGGAGTAGAVATAGVPGLVIPASFFQALWGEVLVRKGAGSLLMRRDLRVDTLVGALRSIDRPEVRAAAAAIGELARAEGGAITAADEIERRLSETGGVVPRAQVS